MVADLTESRDIVASVQMSGPMTAVGDELAEHAEAVTTEAISNAVRHSGASRLTVEVSVADMFTVDIIDNGCGVPVDNPRRSGLANMTRRAEQLGGSCEITSPPGAAPMFTGPLRWTSDQVRGPDVRDQWHTRGSLSAPANPRERGIT